MIPVDRTKYNRSDLGLPSFSPCAWTATKPTGKQSLEKTALVMACVVGQIPCCGALFILSEHTLLCAQPACAPHTRRTIPSRSNTGWRWNGMDGRAPRCAIHQCPVSTPAQVEN